MTQPLFAGEPADEQQEQEFEVEVMRTVSTTVKVRAASGDAAIEKVNRKDFALPPIEEWSGHKDWVYRAYDKDGEEVAEVDR